MSSFRAREAGLEVRDSVAIVTSKGISFAMLLRKKLEEPTLTKQVLKTSTGALNIGACRVAGDLSEFFSKTGNPRSGLGHAKGYGMGEGYGGDRANPPHANGRWPSNLVFVHESGCMSECEPGCPVAILDAQSGERPSTLTGRADPTKLHVNPGDNGGASLFGGGNSNVYADSGGASRFYKQFKTEPELFDYLKILILPESGKLLERFPS